MAFAVVAACNTPPPSKTPPPEVPIQVVSGVTAVYDTLPWQDPNGRLTRAHVVNVVTINGGSPTVVTRLILNRRAEIPPPYCHMMCPVALEPPYVSTSKDRIYVLDGDSTIKEVGMSGTSRTVMSLHLPPMVRAAFAVSPDNRMVAIALIDFKGSSNTVLFVEPLGGGPRINLTTPAVGLAWPIAWRDGKVVLATGRPYVNTFTNPYSALAYALVDPIPGAQPKLIGPRECVPVGLVNSGGTACYDAGVTRCFSRVGWQGNNLCYWRLDWGGNQTTFRLPHVIPASPIGGDAAALSPDGQTIITSRFFFATASGGKVCCDKIVPAQGDYSADRDVGWIDATHIAWSFADHDGTAGRGIIDLRPGSAVATNVAIVGPTVAGHLVATLPGGL